MSSTAGVRRRGNEPVDHMARVDRHISNAEWLVSKDKRPYRLLDVYTLEQGKLRMRIFIAVMLTFVLVGAYLFLRELMSFNVEDADTRDMLEDYRTTIPAIQSYHDEHFPPANVRVRLGTAIIGSLSTSSSRASDIEDPRFYGFLPGPKVSRTGFSSTWLRATTSSSVPDTFSLVDAVDMRLEGQLDADGRVPWFSASTDVESGQVTISLLKTARAYIYYMDGEWKASRFAGSYDPIWTGPWAERQAGVDAVLPSRTSITVEVRDVSEPKALRLPPFSGFFRIFIAIALFVFAFLMCACCCVCQFLIRRNSNTLPAYLFAGMERYRGW